MSGPALAPLLQGFFVEHLMQHKAASPQTVSAYRDAFRLLFQFLQERTGIEPAALHLDHLDATALLAFLDHLENDRGNTPRSRNARLAAFRSFFRYAALKEPASLGILTQVLAIPNKRFPRKQVGYFTRPEMNAILGAPDRTLWAGRRDHALLSTLYNSGARASEICALKREQVTPGANPALRLHGKGRKERVVPLWKKTGSILQVWFREIGAAPHPYAFPNARGGMLTRHGLGYVLRETVQRALPLCPSLAHKKASPHVVRHTTAVHLLQAGIDTSVIALWLGHESLETTHVYLEADLATKEQALSKVDPLGPDARRFKPSDTLLSFLESL
jgi:site-specific recombinase XerD